MPLTKRQREILTFLQTYAEDRGYAPSFEEIAEQFNYNSLATVHEHLSNLERRDTSVAAIMRVAQSRFCPRSFSPARWISLFSAPSQRERRSKP